MLVFEIFLSIRVSFLLVWAGRVPRRCAATALFSTEIRSVWLLFFPNLMQSTLCLSFRFNICVPVPDFCTANRPLRLLNLAAIVFNNKHKTFSFSAWLNWQWDERRDTIFNGDLMIKTVETQVLRTQLVLNGNFLA